MSNIALLKQESSDVSVLYVEDDLGLQQSFSEFLRKLFKKVETASNGLEGLEKFKAGTFDLVITDILMPQMNGIEMTSSIKELNPEQEIIITTAFSDDSYLIKAIELGVDAYILKPVEYEKITSILYKVVKRINNEKKLSFYYDSLEKMVEERSEENFSLTNEKVHNFEMTIMSFVELIEDRDSYTGGHSQRVADYSKLIAEQIGYSEQDCQLVYNAGILHDVGKVVTPDAVLLKPGKLDDLEYNLIKEHVVIGYKLLSKIPMYQDIAEVVRSHHERYDGKGYPDGLSKEQIPSLSRIMNVADAFDAMTTSRIYKARKTVAEAFQELEELAGHQFDPEVVEVAKVALSKIELSPLVTQLPETDIEQERFIYFFKEQETGLFNQAYLDLVLIQNRETTTFQYLSVLKLKDLTETNEVFGRKFGDERIKHVAEQLKEAYPDRQLFRVNGFYFVTTADEPFEFSVEELKCHCEPILIDLSKVDIQTSNDLFAKNVLYV